MIEQKLNKWIGNLSKEVGAMKRKATLSLTKTGLPVGANFPCPYCNYQSRKNRQGSARISDLGNGLIFKCFACGESRSVKNE